MIGKFVVLLLLIAAVRSVQYQPTWQSLDSRPLPLWYDQSKIGILLTWGVYSVPAYGYQSQDFWYYYKGQYAKDYAQFVQHYYRPNITYVGLAPYFTAQYYNAQQWVDLFYSAGARYVLLTSKYSDGYTLFPSNYSYSWNSVAVGPHRDLLGELYTAVSAKSGLHFGVSYSGYEWFNPLYLKDKSYGYHSQEYVNSRVYPELQQLISQYHPEVLLFGGYDTAPDTYWRSRELLSWLYNYSPVRETVVVNDHLGSGTLHTHGGYYSYQNLTQYSSSLLSHKWEHIYPIDRYSYGYRYGAYYYDYSSTYQLIASLIQTVSFGGNFVINVGPTSYGQIPLIVQERLTYMGQWLAINGEGIYQSIPYHVQYDTISKSVMYTQRSNYVYAYILGYPIDYQVHLGSIDPKIVDKIQLLGYNGQISYSPSPDGGIIVKLPYLYPGSQLQYAYGLRITVVERH